MSRKILIWLGMIVGSLLGGLVPKLWGGNLFSFSSIIISAIGALAGVWAGYKLGS